MWVDILSPEIRTKIGFKLQNRRLKLDKKKPLLTEKGIKILEKLIMKRQNLSIFQSERDSYLSWMTQVHSCLEARGLK